jgi:membrane protease YdiL (CAAX protease family)
MKQALLVTTLILIVNYFFYGYGLDEQILSGTYFQNEVRKSLYKIIVYCLPVVISLYIRWNKDDTVCIIEKWRWFSEKWVYAIRISRAIILLIGKQIGSIEFGAYSLFYVHIVNSVVEEVVFRWYLQDWLIRTYNTTKWIILQSVLFLVGHLPFYYSHYQGVLYQDMNNILWGYLPIELWGRIIFLMIWTPIVLWLLRWRTTHKTKSLRPSVVRHSIHNGILLFL